MSTDKQLNTHFEKRDVEIILSALADYARANISDEKLYKEITNISGYIDEELEEWCNECDCVLRRTERDRGTCDDCVNERAIYEIEARNIRDMHKGIL